MAAHAYPALPVLPWDTEFHDASHAKEISILTLLTVYVPEPWSEIQTQYKSM